MKTAAKKIPVGIEDFKKLIEGGFYYVDKTDFIEETLAENIVLYTRPRRFGKTLNMSMLYYFYSMQEKDNHSLFDGLKISRSNEAARHQNQYPVIFLTLKDISDRDFSSALEGFSSLISDVFSEFWELADSDKLLENEKKMFKQYMQGTADSIQLKKSLLFLTKCLYKHFGKPAVVLIDEYDVPLNKAWENGYYDEMCEFIRSLFSLVLKSNKYLEKAVLTGCLRISRESIFTGLNNLTVRSVSDLGSASYFGFTQQEINELYTAYGFANKLPLVKKWYDGYRFGRLEIYNPWSTLQYLHDLIRDSEAQPQAYWANSSGNAIVMNYIRNAGVQTRQEFEDLIHGKSVIKPIREELTYREMENPANIYSFLLLTGYLKSIGKKDGRQNELMIPNQEVREIYEEQFSLYFENLIGRTKDAVFKAMLSQSPEEVHYYLDMLLKRNTSYFDSAEKFYHGLMLGLLLDCGYYITSNQESGDGRYDILLSPEQVNKPMILIELKHTSDENKLEAEAISALKQIKKRRYMENPKYDKFPVKIGYGISFNKKDCCVKLLTDDIA